MLVTQNADVYCKLKEIYSKNIFNLIREPIIYINYILVFFICWKLTEFLK